MTKPYRSCILAAIHKTAEDLHNVGLLDEPTMRDFDEACLTPTVANRDPLPRPPRHGER